MTRYENNLLEQSHHTIKQRTRPMLEFKWFDSAARFCHAFEEVRYWFRLRQRITQAVALADPRHLFEQRCAPLQAIMLAA
jgi:transposase-like protein